MAQFGRTVSTRFRTENNAPYLRGLRGRVPPATHGSFNIQVFCHKTTGCLGWRSSLPISYFAPVLATTHAEILNDAYVKWLSRRNESVLVLGGGTWWFPYHGCLVPASLKPQPVELTEAEAAKLLEESGALLLRYFSRISDEPTAFWYVACERYDFDGVSHNTRSKIRRAYKRCTVERVDATWLAKEGYGCYSAAFDRYRGARPTSKTIFQRGLLDSVGGPFEFWAVFAGAELAGYAKCVLGDDYVATVVIKLAPEYLPLYSAYGLWDTILKQYVNMEARPVFNGFRALAHDTNVQDFLRKFGFQKVYCDLKIVYRKKLGLCVRVLYPFKLIASLIPDSLGGAGVRAMLAQEEIRRSFLRQNTSPV